MPLIKLKSQSERVELENLSEDYRSAKRTEQYRFSQKAIYFPAFPGNRYLPYDALTKALTRNMSLSVTGTCGKQLPMVRLRAYYDGEFYHDFMFEKPANANAVMDAIAARRPDLPMERETRPLHNV